jgi:hypothetical protein
MARKESRPAAAFWARIATAIARHGAEATVAGMDGVRDVPVGELLLSRAADLDMDLIMMGACS